MKVRLAHPDDIQHEFCDECNSDVDEVLVLGDRRHDVVDPVEDPFKVCWGCLAQAVEQRESMTAEARTEQQYISDVARERRRDMERERVRRPEFIPQSDDGQ